MKKYFILFVAALISLVSCQSDLASDISSAGSTQSGSYANLLVIGDFMYVINIQNLSTYNVENADDPVLVDDQEIGFNIESLLHHKGNLFIGSPEAMHIFAISDDGVPERKSITEYGTLDQDFCRRDPIAVNDNYAFASLSSVLEGECFRQELNELRVYDISNLAEPILKNSLQMDSPRGIALDNDILFVCEARQGLKIYDVSNEVVPELLYHFDGFQAFDLIPDNGLLVIVGPEKIYEYDYSDITNVTFLGEVDI